MGKDTTVVGGLTIGLDLGDKHTVGCVLTGSGEVEETFRVATTMSALGRTMAGFESSRVVLEVGTHSPWVSRLVEQAGHEVIIASPRRVRLIAENDSKTDEVDAELLARLCRVDPGLLKPIVHRGKERSTIGSCCWLAMVWFVRVPNSSTRFVALRSRLANGCLRARRGRFLGEFVSSSARSCSQGNR